MARSIPTRAMVCVLLLLATRYFGSILEKTSAQGNVCEESGCFGVNVILNGDAEAGPGAPNDSEMVPAPGWTSAGNFTVVAWGGAGGLPTVTDPGPPDRGLNLFAGGPGNPSSSAR